MEDRFNCLSAAIDFCLAFKDNSTVTQKGEDILLYADIFYAWLKKE